MKKKFIYYIFSVFAFCFLLTNVEAETINKDDVPNSTYVIGTHMFTRDTNDVYNGQLTTKLIMLASKTIEGDNLDDMIIYYKNARGKWIDALSGNAVTTSDSFEVEYVDTKMKIATPKIAKVDTTVSSDNNAKVGTLHIENVDFSKIKRLNIYYATKADGEYSIIKTAEGEDLKSEIALPDVPLGSHYYFKVNVFVKDTDNNGYSDYSNVVDIDNSILVPKLRCNTYVYSQLNQMQDGYISIENYRDFYLNESEATYKVSGVEIYETFINNNGKKIYNLVTTINPDSFYGNVFNFSDNNLTYVARAYVINASGEKIYSDYSNEVEFDVSQGSDRNNISLEEFENITKDITLGELKDRYNIEPSITNDGTTSTYLYDFKGYVNNSVGITPNIQFEFDSNSADAKVKSKVYMNDVDDKEIDHSLYDDGNGIIELTDFDSIVLTTPEELKQLLGKPYMIKTIYEREISSTEYPTTEYIYKIKDSNMLLWFSFSNNGKGIILAENLASYYKESRTGKTYVSKNGDYTLTIDEFSEKGTQMKITLSSKDEILRRTITTEVRATALGKIDPVYEFGNSVGIKTAPNVSSMAAAIVGNLRFTTNGLIIKCHVFKKTEYPASDSIYDTLNLGYNEIEFTLKAD